VISEPSDPDERPVIVSGLSAGTSPSFGMRIMGGIAWLGLALLAVVVKIWLFPRHRGAGATAVLWGVVFGLFLWWGSHQVGAEQRRAILLGVVAGVASAFYIYIRGSAAEGPQAVQPGVFLGRRFRRGQTDARAETRPVVQRGELARARSALDRGKPTHALFELHEARKVAVAQRKLDELVEVRDLVDRLSARSRGRVKEASERLAQQVREDLRGFAPDELAAVGIELEPDPVEPVLARWRSLAREHGPVRTRELTRARAAMEEDRFTAALFELRTAQHVAVAQRRPDELLAVQELALAVSDRSSGRARVESDELVRRVEAGLRTLAAAGDVPDP
jgi:hypothetical protein